MQQRLTQVRAHLGDVTSRSIRLQASIDGYRRRQVAAVQQAAKAIQQSNAETQEPVEWFGGWPGESDDQTGSLAEASDDQDGSPSDPIVID